MHSSTSRAVQIFHVHRPVIFTTGLPCSVRVYHLKIQQRVRRLIEFNIILFFTYVPFEPARSLQVPYTRLIPRL